MWVNDTLEGMAGTNETHFLGLASVAPECTLRIKCNVSTHIEAACAALTWVVSRKAFL